MFEKYKNYIKNLNRFEKEDILTNKFLLYKENNLEIYYAPHNEIVNKFARIFIVGITPGWTQTKIAYTIANKYLQEGASDEEVKQAAKRSARFAGSMRTNLVLMLDELKLNEKLNIKSCACLFNESDNLLHTTSLIPYPVFCNKKNYTGSNPKISKSEVLYKYVKTYFYKEVSEVNHALIIPLGKSTSEILELMIEDGIIKKEQCLLGFPHPSGANGHRKIEFRNNLSEMTKIIDNYFK